MQFLSPDQVARIAHVQVQTVYRWIAQGRIPTSKPGKYHLILESDLKAFLDSPQRERLQTFVEAIVSHAPELTDDQVQLLRDVVVRRSAR